MDIVEPSKFGQEKLKRSPMGGGAHACLNVRKDVGVFERRGIEFSELLKLLLIMVATVQDGEWMSMTDRRRLFQCHGDE